ncbi:hypothetical protein AB0C13_38960 [Streptomyces sp. NPDC049099]|uniref:hypothetical protein n=1 Tax=Streptomyces sp. NPDC049099 TaxID=3155768 RepID=UPI00341851CE
MPYSVDLAFRVEEALAELSENGRQEVMETIAAALVGPGSWPAPGRWDGVLRFGSRCWVAFTAYDDGIEVYDVGCVG